MNEIVRRDANNVVARKNSGPREPVLNGNETPVRMRISNEAEKPGGVVLVEYTDSNLLISKGYSEGGHDMYRIVADNSDEVDRYPNFEKAVKMQPNLSKIASVAAFTAWVGSIIAYLMFVTMNPSVILFGGFTLIPTLLILAIVHFGVIPNRVIPMKKTIQFGSMLDSGVVSNFKNVLAKHENPVSLTNAVRRKLITMNDTEDGNEFILWLNNFNKIFENNPEFDPDLVPALYVDAVPVMKAIEEAAAEKKTAQNALSVQDEVEEQILNSHRKAIVMEQITDDSARTREIALARIQSEKEW